MTTIDVLTLLLALSTAVHLGSAAAFTAWRGGTNSAHALLIGASATASALGLFLTTVGTYR